MTPWLAAFHHQTEAGWKCLCAMEPENNPESKYGLQTSVALWSLPTARQLDSAAQLTCG